MVALFADAGVGDVRRVPTDDGSDAVIGHSPGPEGAPTVLLYSHYDVQPADPAEWASSPWELTERDGRLYGRGAADCKGNLVMLLTVLRALPKPWPVGVRVVCEGSEEMSLGGLGRLVGTDPGLFAADVMLIADAGNIELGTPTVTTSLRGTGSVLVTVRTMAGPAHSGMYGGAAPDALAALSRCSPPCATTPATPPSTGLDNTGTWDGADYPADRFAGDAQVLPGVGLLGSGSVADTVWARPAATVLAIDAPSVANVTAAIQHEARAVVNLRVPPGQDAAAAQRLLVRAPRGGGAVGRPGHRRAEDAGRAVRGAHAGPRASPRWRPAWGRRTAATWSRPARAARSPCATRWPRPTRTPRSC